MINDVVVREVGTHRGAPRLYLDMPEVARAKFNRGTLYRLDVNESERKVVLHVDANGDRVVSGKEGKGGVKPLIDLSSNRVLKMFAGQQVRLVFMTERIYILPLASVVAQEERLERLRGKLERGEPLAVASIAHGAGIMSHATHAGAQEAGIELQNAMVNEIDADLIGLSRGNNSTWGAGTRGLNMPMQELVQDNWLMSRLPRVEVLEGGIPCSAAARCGITKNKLSVPEAHPEVGHLMAPTLMLIRQMQPAIVVIENVPTYAQTGSAWMMRSMLRDSGYTCHEVELDAHDFGSVEPRKRWFLVATTNGLVVELDNLAPEVSERQQLGQLLDDLPVDDPRWRTFDYLKKKAVRDKEAGKGFKMQFMTPEDTRIATLRKGYHKGGSVDPLLRHPSDPDLLRLLTGDEHVRVKRVPSSLVEGCTDVQKHQVLGQAVDYEVVKSLMRRVFEWVRKSCAAGEASQGAAPAQYGLKGVG